MTSAVSIRVLDLNSEFSCCIEFASFSTLTVRTVKEAIAASHPFLIESINLVHRGLLWFSDDSPLFLLVEDFFEAREIVLYMLATRISKEETLRAALSPYKMDKLSFAMAKACVMEDPQQESIKDVVAYFEGATHAFV